MEVADCVCLVVQSTMNMNQPGYSALANVRYASSCTSHFSHFRKTRLMPPLVGARPLSSVAISTLLMGHMDGIVAFEVK